MTPADTAWDAPWDASTFRDDVEKQLLGFVDEHAAWLDRLGEDAQRLVAAARTSVIGGKRFRAAFCYWGHHAVAGTVAPEDEAALVRACASLELLHASALVLDDYIDASDVQRGRPAARGDFGALRQRSGSRGTRTVRRRRRVPARRSAAHSPTTVRTCGLDGERVRAAQAFLDLTRGEVVTALFLDVTPRPGARRRRTGRERVATSPPSTPSWVRSTSARPWPGRPVGRSASSPGSDSRSARRSSCATTCSGFSATRGHGPAGRDDLAEGKRTCSSRFALDALYSRGRSSSRRQPRRALDEERVARLRELINWSARVPRSSRSSTNSPSAR